MKNAANTQCYEVKCTFDAKTYLQKFARGIYEIILELTFMENTKAESRITTSMLV